MRYRRTNMPYHGSLCSRKQCQLSCTRTSLHLLLMCFCTSSYGSKGIADIFATFLVFHHFTSCRWIGYYMDKRQKFSYQEFIPLTIPLAMILFGGLSVSFLNIVHIVLVWQAIIATGSFFYSVVAVNAGHHGPDLVHQGDEFKSLDYGIYQLGATIDRVETKKNLFLSLTHFGDHLLVSKKAVNLYDTNQNCSLNIRSITCFPPWIMLYCRSLEMCCMKPAKNSTKKLPTAHSSKQSLISSNN
jgi:hypothetical protein